MAAKTLTTKVESYSSTTLATAVTAVNAAIVTAQALNSYQFLGVQSMVGGPDATPTYVFTLVYAYMA